MLPRLPWTGFINRLVRQRHSSNLLLGPVGMGKTELALKLAWRWRERHGYKVEMVEGYDKPDWVTTISMRTLVSRMGRLRAYLNSLAEPDEEELDGDEEAEEPGGEVRFPPTRRVVIIDEAGLAMSTRATDPARQAALMALAQSRHMETHCVFIGQWAGLIPLPLFGQSIVWVKRPSGRELFTDRDNPIVRDLWERAAAGFDSIRRSPHYVEPYDDPRAWAYCDCLSLSGGPGFTGMVPFTRAPLRVEDDQG